MFKKNQLFNDTIQTDTPAIEKFITNIAPYFICNHYISREIDKENYDKSIYFYGATEFKMRELAANNLLKNKNYDTINNFDIVYVQVDFFDYFYDEILPIITLKNIKIILMTGQWHLPQINKNEKTEALLKNDNIFLWISQNPIYSNNEKYMALPYGISHHSIEVYINFIQSNIINEKQLKILNQRATVHSHLPDNHIRKKYDIFGKNSGDNLYYYDFLKNISMSEFVISTTGDREDCYRHYECIGLNAIPISNASEVLYKDVFGENMIYSNANEMIDMINSKIVNYEYQSPNKDILTIEYWKQKINERIDMLKCKNT